ncbi:MarR family transcriptional regulator [Methylocella tundrae]|uniref:MarR family transcriptional regulator n=1 Tax=Methylocella tundrae TaxID=227605 RepID=UPI00106D2D0A|nr:helix-turn-helix domain-containing protein [Methylocella tundrae]WPP02664.1 helix-turn-helix domain-containing protein [Methylocella tundrae]
MTDSEKTLLASAASYVEHVLQTPLIVDGPAASAKLPAFLTQRYVLVDGEILGRPCILMLGTGLHDDTPATIAKHRDLLRRQSPGRAVILVTERLSNHNRHRLISQHVPFIVPGNQLFVPELGADLREHFRSERDTPGDGLTPTAQLIVLAALMGRIGPETTPSELASQFRYSAMSMSRAITELEAFELAETEVAGRFRHLRFTVPREALWSRARPHLRTPVRKRRRVRRPPQGLALPLAGETALAEKTDLSFPRVETRAMAASEWKALATRYELDQPVSWDEPVIELETWTYDPLLLGDDKLVDTISLYLSLPDSTDDRIEAAKDALLRQVGL